MSSVDETELGMDTEIRLEEITAVNWRACVELEVYESQTDFVHPVSRYLVMCQYGGVWHPLAITRAGEVVGFVMWATDPDEDTGWIGGLVVDRSVQGHGIGRAAVLALLDKLHVEEGCGSAALSYSSANSVARQLYAELGFVETGEFEEQEVVARLVFPAG
jgi:diamine N-acetyltransferase